MTTVAVNYVVECVQNIDFLRWILGFFRRCFFILVLIWISGKEQRDNIEVLWNQNGWFVKKINVWNIKKNDVTKWKNDFKTFCQSQKQWNSDQNQRKKLNIYFDGDFWGFQLNKHRSRISFTPSSINDENLYFENYTITRQNLVDEL